MTTEVPADHNIRLNDGAHIPRLGLGVMFVSTEDVPALMKDATAIGYRHFDTATHYFNEAGVGEGLRQIEIDRDAVFVTTKLPNAAHGYDEALHAFEASERAIGRIDLYLIHWPQPIKGRYRDSWRALVRLQNEGRLRSIGVANFPVPLLDELIADTGVTPAVNQVELHPSYQQPALRADLAKRGIATESWSPLERGQTLSNPAIQAIAERRGYSPAQIVLAWHLQNNLIVIPKAADRRHLSDNFAALDLHLAADDLAQIALLDQADGNFGPDPMLPEK